MPDFDTFYENIEHAFGEWQVKDATERDNAVIEVNLKNAEAKVCSEEKAKADSEVSPMFIIRPEDYAMYDPDTNTYTFNQYEIEYISREITIASSSIVA